MQVLHKRNYGKKNGQPIPPQNLDYGEIAVNYATDVEALFIKNNGGTIVDFRPKKYIDGVVNNVTSSTQTQLNNLSSQINNTINNQIVQINEHINEIDTKIQHISVSGTTLVISQDTNLTNFELAEY